MQTVPSRSHPQPAVDRFVARDGAQPQSIPQFVRRNAAETPDQVAFRTRTADGWTGRTWRTVHNDVTRIAAGLVDLTQDGDGTDSPMVGYVIGPNAPEYFIAEYALQAIGVAAFPLFEPMTTQEMRSTLASYSADVAFSGSQATTERLLAACDILRLRHVVQSGSDPLPDDERVLSLDSLRERGDRFLGDDPDVVDERIDATGYDDVACIILTSGTTGVSKGVLGSHRYMLDIAARYAHVYSAGAFDRYLSYLPAAFSVEQYNGLTLAAAAPLDVAFASAPSAVAQDFVLSRACLKFLGPRQWEELRASLPTTLISDLAEVRHRKADLRAQLGLQHVKAGISAGGSLSAEVFEFFRALDLEIRNVYGFAEVGIVTSTVADDPPESVGRALPSPYGDEPIEIRIDDSGEILTRGGVRCSGYWGNAHELSLTDDGWLRSGDAGELDGRALHVLDRVVNIHKLPNGTTFAPQPVEISALGSPYISNILLVGGRGQDARIGALVQLNDTAVRNDLYGDEPVREAYEDLTILPKVVDLLVEAIRQVNATLPASQRIALIGVLPKPLSPEDGELTRSMKLRRSAVTQRYDQLIDAMYSATNEEVSFDAYVGPEGEGAMRPFQTRVAHV